ncbi:rab gtpase [Tubulinosema ratisbonensis]|uniref:Rab gtpase n=1 Tax=Tubulinosema ratisbonensis TaxID=291195 RepID=A0A437ALD1_9MICR|nr:rab gtpase [Tubulinosema ratisbonensis]
MDTEYDYLFKITLIGDSGVGKTCFLLQYTDSVFADEYVSTIGVDFKIKTINLDNKKCKLQLWDTAGQERFNAITKSYYRGSHGIIVLFDLTNLESFESLDKWLKKIEEYASSKREILILGNKSDMKDKIAVNKEENVIPFLKKWNIPLERYFEVSAKDNLLVSDAFESLTKVLIDKSIKGVFESKDKNKLKEIVENASNSRCC